MLRLITFAVIVLMTGNSLGQDWIESNGIEYNCALLRVIIHNYGEQQLTRTAEKTTDLVSHFETLYPACVEQSSAETDGEESLGETNIIEAGGTEAGEPSQVEGENESCYPYEVVYSRTSLGIRSGFQHSNFIGRTDPSEPLHILRSVQTGSICWLYIGVGWIPESSSLSPIKSSPQPPLESESLNSSNGEKCFPHDTAYIVGSMNIRSQATVASAKAGVAEPGEYYEVTESRQGDDYCWLNIDKGWMAKTGLVSEDITSILPPIKGDESFRRLVIRAFEYLAEKSHYWFTYTAPKLTLIQPDPNLGSAARVIASSGVTTIESNYYRRQTIVDRASTLVHEACHVHQWDDGKRSFLGWDLEQECYATEVRFLMQVNPRDREGIKWHRCMAENYPIESLCTPFWIELSGG